VSGPDFTFCVPGLVFDGTGGVGSLFHVLRSRRYFRLYRGCRVTFSCFVHPDTYSAVARASGPVFMFCAPELIFGGTEGIPSCCPLSDMFLAVPRASGPVITFCAPVLIFSSVRRVSGPVFMFSTPEHVFGGSEGVGPVFMYCAPVLIFGGTEGVGNHFHILCSRTRFRRYRGCRLSFSCFALPESFSAVPRVSVPVFMFCASGLIFGGT
jgi:hypothetical protein